MRTTLRILVRIESYSNMKDNLSTTLHHSPKLGTKKTILPCVGVHPGDVPERAVGWDVTGRRPVCLDPESPLPGWPTSAWTLPAPCYLSHAADHVQEIVGRPGKTACLRLSQRPYHGQGFVAVVVLLLHLLLLLLLLLLLTLLLLLLVLLLLRLLFPLPLLLLLLLIIMCGWRNAKIYLLTILLPFSSSSSRDSLIRWNTPKTCNYK